MLRVRAGSPPGPDVAPGAATRDFHTALAIGRRNGIEIWRLSVAPPFKEFLVIDDLSAVIAASDPSERRTKLFGLDYGR